MNKLPSAARRQILSLMCEGASMGLISRTCGVSINTVTKLLFDAGEACAALHDEKMRDVKVSRISCDETWSFCYARTKNVLTAKDSSAGEIDIWTWTALDADSKLILSWYCGDRSSQSAMALIDDIRSRLADHKNATIDRRRASLDAVGSELDGDVNDAIGMKLYDEAAGSAGCDSVAECIEDRKHRIEDHPNSTHVNSYFMEQQNFNMRMSMRRYTCITNAFSKRLDNHMHSLAIYFFHYNFCRIHKALRMSPAMASGVTATLLDWDTVIARIEDGQAPKVRGPY